MLATLDVGTMGYDPDLIPGRINSVIYGTAKQSILFAAGCITFNPAGVEMECDMLVATKDR